MAFKGPIAPPGFALRSLERSDLTSVVEICNEAIRRGESTLGPDPLTAEQMADDLSNLAPKFESQVAVDLGGGDVAGWAALAPHTHREVYNVSGELRVFVASSHRGRGIGGALASHMLGRAEQLGFHTLVTLLPAPAAASLSWLRRLGFAPIGTLASLLPAGEDWCDVALLQRFIGSGQRDVS